jgi:hypothetical protein
MGIKRLVGPSTPKLIVEGARDHNLKASPSSSRSITW